MTDTEYNTAIHEASEEAREGGPLWNKRFVDGLKKRGLRLMPFDGEHIPEELKAYVMAPWPFSEGEPQWPRQSLIVPLPELGKIYDGSIPGYPPLDETFGTMDGFHNGPVK